MNARHADNNFNPYHKWLGIPERKCPPTFYDLLGISLNEDDRTVIESAATRQRTHVEQFLGTSHNSYANQLISQINEAEFTLLNPELRREYDRKAKLFKKRKKSRQIDPTSRAPKPGRGSSRIIGEGSDLFREYVGIVSFLALAFFGMAAAALYLPWEKLNPSQNNSPQQAAAAQPVAPQQAQDGKQNDNPETVLAKNSSAPEKKKTTAPKPVTAVGMQFRLLPGGQFLMGSKTKPVTNATIHSVTLTRPFELGIHEVTQQQYEAVMGANPSTYKGPDSPVENVSWNDAVEFCRKLSKMPAEKAAGYRYRLPTEAEWEYACRAGSTTKYSFGDAEAKLGDYAWYYENSRVKKQLKTHPVGQKQPNAWGLYDMYGNVFEWCQDRYGPYPKGVVTDPMGAESGTERVMRGGGYSNIAGYCSSAYRSHVPPDVRKYAYGFRVVRESTKPSTQALPARKGNREYQQPSQ
jgi:formylglycine-generating enzyme required for sulfatase activity